MFDRISFIGLAHLQQLYVYLCLTLANVKLIMIFCSSDLQANNITELSSGAFAELGDLTTL